MDGKLERKAGKLEKLEKAGKATKPGTITIETRKLANPYF